MELQEETYAVSPLSLSTQPHAEQIRRSLGPTSRWILKLPATKRWYSLFKYLFRSAMCSLTPSLQFPKDIHANPLVLTLQLRLGKNQDQNRAQMHGVRWEPTWRQHQGQQEKGPWVAERWVRGHQGKVALRTWLSSLLHDELCLMLLSPWVFLVGLHLNSSTRKIGGLGTVDFVTKLRTT